MKQKIIDFWKNSAILSQITKAENRYFRRRCENTHYTILTPNCMAGLIYSRLGEPFYSPTINTNMQSEDFIKFLSDLDYYLAQDVQEWVDDTVDYPVGIIRGRTPGGRCTGKLCTLPLLCRRGGKSGIPVKSALIPIISM